jgi:hypothetical protein
VRQNYLYVRTNFYFERITYGLYRTDWGVSAQLKDEEREKT